MNKLILAIIFNTEAVEPLLMALLAKDYSVTKVSSVGGFLRRQNTTFVIGVEEARLEEAMNVIREVCSPFTSAEGHAATIFVLNVAEFARA